MIRLNPSKFERIDPIEEKRKARSSSVGTFIVFLTFCGMIRMIPLALEKLNT